MTTKCLTHPVAGIIGMYGFLKKVTIVQKKEENILICKLNITEITVVCNNYPIWDTFKNVFNFNNNDLK